MTDHFPGQAPGPAMPPQYGAAFNPQQMPRRSWFRRHLTLVIVGACALALVFVVMLVGVVALLASDGTGGPDHEALAKIDPSKFTVVDAAAWTAIQKNPDAAEGKRVVIFANILQFDTATGSDTFMAGAGTYQPTEEYEFEMDTMFRGAPDTLAKFKQDDVVRIYGQVAGAQEYDTLVGGRNAVPLIDIAKIENVGFADLKGDVKVGKVIRGEYGEVTVELTVTNSAAKAMSYNIELSARSSNGSKSVGQAYASTPKIEPGASLKIDADGFYDLPEGAKIQVDNVARHEG